MIERILRSWELVRASAGVLRDDRELLVLPVVSGLCTIIVAFAFLAPAYFTGLLTETGQETESLGLYAWVFAFYLVQYFVIIFFNTALVGAALMRLDGGNPTLGDALAIAFGRIGTIAGYAVISATIGLVLRIIGERLGPIGRIVEAVIGVAWSVTTFLVVPIIAARGVGPLEAIRESAGLLRKSWGENIIGSAGIGLVFSFIFIPVAFLGFGAAGFLLTDARSELLGFLVGAFTVIVLAGMAVYASALGGVYSAALYRYAADRPTRGFDRSLLSDAFRPRP